MKLIECYIENFGKISKQKFSFTDGLNCITADNGSGKTTLAAFIKVMLYGMSDTKKASLEENDRKHYLPWGGGVCGGSLTFSANGKTYRVERSFAPKAADDSYTLYDTATGRISTDFSEGLGEGLFGIDADGFERTVYLSERALTPKSDNKSISAKLSDLVGCDGDIGGMDDALKVLEEKRKFYYKKGGAGEIADTQAKINDIARQLENLDAVEKSADANNKKMQEIARNIDAAREEAKIINAKREEAVRRTAEVGYEKQYKEMKASLEETIKRRSAVSEIFGLNIPSHQEIDEASYKALEAKHLRESSAESAESKQLGAMLLKFDGKVDKAVIEDARIALAKLKSRKNKDSDPNIAKAKKIFSGRVPTESELDHIETLINNKKLKTPIGCIIGYILSVICICVGLILEQRLIAVGVIGNLLSLIAEIAIKNRSNKRRKAEIYNFFGKISEVEVNTDEEAKARLADMRILLPVMAEANDEGDTRELADRLVRLVALFPDKSGMEILYSAEGIIAEYDRYTELAVTERYKTGERASQIEKAERLRGEVDEFLGKYKTRTDDPFGELRRALTEYDRLTADIVAKRSEMERLESLYRMGEGSQQMAKAELEMLDKKRQENEMHIANLEREYALTQRAYSSEIYELDGREGLEMRKAELEELLTKHVDRYDTVLLTKKYLTAAKDNMTSKYLGKTKAGFLGYTEKIGGITGESFEMDTDFGVTKQEGATTRTVEAYSRGTRDLFNLAARLGLVDALYERERPFILLDDPFTAFDDGKTDAALRLLKELSKDRQIIYFTCATSRSI